MPAVFLTPDRQNEFASRAGVPFVYFFMTVFKMLIIFQNLTIIIICNIISLR